MNSSEESLGFIGMGLMGIPICKHLLAAGQNLTVWNRTAEKCQELTTAGAVHAETLQDLAKKSDIIFICLSDDEAVKSVVLGKQGLLAHLRSHHLIVDLSTIAPHATRDLAQEVMLAGASWVDAPMSGGVLGAEKGNLILMAGGMESSIERCRPVTQLFSQRLRAMGPVGAGQTTKLCNQLIVAANSLLIAEAVALAQNAGVDAQQLAPALAGGFADSLPLQILAPRMAQHIHEPVQWKVATLHKDLSHVLALAAHAGLTLPVAQRALEQLSTAIQTGAASLDLSHIIDLYIVPKETSAC
ncbi:MAG: NAD(P)-dependent oxidoreductase [Pseudomonadales bacterium]|nr:NAD(P)-dependent oxidoreductase [Pseudomonadales bacterium]